MLQNIIIIIVITITAIFSIIMSIVVLPVGVKCITYVTEFHL